ncbi:MAG: 3'-5' exonuclease domain-containing protein 2 [Bacteroidales bacterium]|nr:3'-5' exonuclease domain-containing protein 2 [Bacteroidales bacterium]
MKNEMEELALTKDELTALPAEKYTNRIVVIDTQKEVEKAVNYLRGFKIIGFDTETRPSFKKGKQHQVALLQLSTEECAFLFRINRIGLPDILKDLLESKDILKIGLSLKDDFAALHRIASVEFASFIELQNLAQKFHIKNRGLRGIYGVLFGKKISKAQRLSNWEADVLSEAQKEYAALDAWASLRIYTHLCGDN